MNVIQLIIVIMVVTITGTITLAAASYLAFRMRERRSPQTELGEAETFAFFERVNFLAPEARPES